MKERDQAPMAHDSGRSGRSPKVLAYEGIEIAYAVDGAGPDLLFVHNGGTSSTIWRHQVASLSARYRVITVDLPGFGCAVRQERPADWQSQVALLGMVLDAVGATSVLAVGNCMGSNLVVGLAAARPALVRALVLVNPLTEATFSAGWLGALHAVDRFAPWPSRAVRGIARRFVPPRVAASAALRMQLGDKGLAKGLHHDAELLAANQRKDQLPALIDVLDDMGAYGKLDRREGEMSHPLPPVCTIWGAQNKMLSPRAGEVLDEVLGVERAEVLAGCGHLPMLEDPAAVTAAIDEFARLHLVVPARAEESAIASSSV